jgi:hypothetical protein
LASKDESIVKQVLNAQMAFLFGTTVSMVSGVGFFPNIWKY